MEQSLHDLISNIINGADDNNWRDCMREILRVASGKDDEAYHDGYLAGIYTVGEAIAQQPLVITGGDGGGGGPEPKIYTQDDIDSAYRQGRADCEGEI